MRARRIVGTVAVAAALGLVWWVYPVVRDLVGAGFLDRGEAATYVASREANLRAIRTALLQYHDSEERFPFANGWERAIADRLRPSNMSAKDAEKKLVRPDLQGTGPGVGYAISSAHAGRYRDDVPKAETVLVYESRQRVPSASGRFSEDGDGMGITMDGSLVTR